jgi:5-formyltetrahydrofolate cyclo-ligase
MTSLSDKTALREQMRTVRRRLAREIPDGSQKAAAAAMAAGLPAWPVIASYHPQGSEMDPGPFVAALVARDASAVVLPVGEDRYEPLIFREPDPEQAEVIDAFGIPGPDAECPERRPDLVIVPLLAFDASGGRLGQGAGAYDRTLANLRASGGVFVLGLAYSGQEIEQVPMDAHDQKLDAVLTETGYRKF